MYIHLFVNLCCTWWGVYDQVGRPRVSQPLNYYCCSFIFCIYLQLTTQWGLMRIWIPRSGSVSLRQGKAVTQGPVWQRHRVLTLILCCLFDWTVSSYCPRRQTFGRALSVFSSFDFHQRIIIIGSFSHSKFCGFIYLIRLLSSQVVWTCNDNLEFYTCMCERGRIQLY